jgi:predicted HAD superfamily phosphohydrolase
MLEQLYWLPEINTSTSDRAEWTCLVVDYNGDRYPQGIIDADSYLQILRERVTKLIVKEFARSGKKSTFNLINNYFPTQEKTIIAQNLAKEIVTHTSTIEKLSSFFKEDCFPLISVSQPEEIVFARAIMQQFTMESWLNIMFELAIAF